MPVTSRHHREVTGRIFTAIQYSPLQLIELIIINYEGFERSVWNREGALRRYGLVRTPSYMAALNY
jgi:hypothetical protein